MLRIVVFHFVSILVLEMSSVMAPASILDSHYAQVVEAYRAGQLFYLESATTLSGTFLAEGRTEEYGNANSQSRAGNGLKNRAASYYEQRFLNNRLTSGATAFWRDLVFVPEWARAQGSISLRIEIDGYLSAYSEGGNVLNNGDHSSAIVRYGFEHDPLVWADRYDTDYLVFETSAYESRVRMEGSWNFDNGRVTRSVSETLSWDEGMQAFGFSLVMTAGAEAAAGWARSDFGNSLVISGVYAADGTLIDPREVRFDSGYRLSGLDVPEPSSLTIVVSLGLVSVSLAWMQRRTLRPYA